MIKHLWSILAERTSVDQQTNNLSILGVVEELTIQAPEDIKFPANIPFRHTIVSFWQKDKPSDDVKFDLVIDLLAPDGAKVV